MLEKPAVHRIVEQHAATRGESPAIVSGDAVLSYRDLNYRANAVTRHLMDAGFRRGDHATISMLPGPDLATVLLAVLKGGGSYTWESMPGPLPCHVVVAAQPGAALESSRRIDVSGILGQSIRPGPNLPILTRPSDIACVLTETGEPPLLVPHATIAALPAPIGSPLWAGDRTTFDLWTGLLSGATLTVEFAPELLKAA